MSSALILNLGVFRADNNLRRNIASFSANFQSPVGVTHFDKELAAADDFTFESVAGAEGALVLQSSQPLQVVINVDVSNAINVPVQRLLVIDFPFLSLVVTNTGTEVAKLFIIQS